ncbi:MAG: DUF5655 domain-containing protein [Candidatus Nanopelagicales bacterium]
MGVAPAVSLDEYFSGHPFALEVFRTVEAVLARTGPFSVRVTKSQAAFRRRRSFAFVWIPGQYLAKPGAEVVLAIALGRHDASPRFKEVAHPSPRQWIHHLEVHSVDDVDDEVVRWLLEAAERAT